MLKVSKLLILFLGIVFLLALKLEAGEKVYLVKVKASINPGTGTYLIDSIKKANKDKVKLIVIELDTPGGLVQTTRLLVQEMLSSEVPIVVNVTPPGAHAGSAGVMITMAAHIAAMAPGTNIGAAHPVAISPGGLGKQKDGEADVMMEKIVSDISAFVEGIAKTRGRNVEWAISAVKKSASITADEALKKGVIDFVAKDTKVLLKKIDGFIVKGIDGRRFRLDLKGIEVVELPMSFKLTVLSFFADPNIAYLLMMLAALGIYLELSNPGLIVPGVVGGISGILAMMSFHLLPITAAGVLLLVGGLILITLEFFVPGFGILGAGGTVGLVLGGIFLVDPVKTDITVSYSMLVPVGILFGSIVVLVAFFVLSARKRAVLTGYNGMFGLKAKVLSFNAKKQRGKLAVRGEIWTFTSQDRNIELVNGDEVIIRDKEGMILIVNKE